MDTVFTWISLAALISVAVIYFLTRKVRLKVHEEVVAKKTPWTKYPQTTLSVGIVLVVLGIIINTDYRIINYIMIGIGELVSVIEFFRIRSSEKSAADK